MSLTVDGEDGTGFKWYPRRWTVDSDGVTESRPPELISEEFVPWSSVRSISLSGGSPSSPKWRVSLDTDTYHEFQIVLPADEAKTVARLCRRYLSS